MKQEKVFSGDFSNMKLGVAESERVFVNSDIKKIYNLQTTNIVNCSGLHRFFGVENFSVVEKEVKELMEGDFIAQVGKFDINGDEQKLPSVNVRRIGKISKIASVISKCQ